VFMVESQRPNQRQGLIHSAEEIWIAGARAVDAADLVSNFLTISSRGLHFGDWIVAHEDYQDIFVIGAGKCSGEMALALERVFLSTLPPEKKWKGRVQVPDDRVFPTTTIELLGVRPAGVNLPTERVLASTGQLKHWLAATQEKDLVICLISGGGSALLELPRPPVQLSDLVSVTEYLSQSGASIEQLNTVRRVLSQVKGGGLLQLAGSRRWVTLIVSDIWGDPLNLIASGPTFVDSAFEDQSEKLRAEAIKGLQVLQTFYDAKENIPAHVMELLTKLMEPIDDPAEAAESGQGVSPSHDLACEVQHFVLGNNPMAVQAAADQAGQLGFECGTEFDWLIDGGSAPVEQVADRIADQLWQVWQQTDLELNGKGEGKGATDRSESDELLAGGQSSSATPAPAPTATKRCIVSGGEPTVRLDMKGKKLGEGGRNQHLILLVMRSMIERILREGAWPSGDFCFLSAGTDGEDGNTRVGGAWFDQGALVRQASRQALALIDFHLTGGDSHSLLKQWGLLFTPQGMEPGVAPVREDQAYQGIRTNVCDLRVLLVSSVRS